MIARSFPPSNFECPVSWHSFDDKCYKLLDEPLTWFDANKTCNEDGGNLASIQTDEENNFIFELAGENPVSLGGNDLDTEGTWTWSDEREWGEFINWGENEPNNIEGEHCIEIRHFNGRWNDYNCGQKLKAVCKKESNKGKVRS